MYDAYAYIRDTLCDTDTDNRDTVNDTVRPYAPPGAQRHESSKSDTKRGSDTYDKYTMYDAGIGNSFSRSPKV